MLESVGYKNLPAFAGLFYHFYQKDRAGRNSGFGGLFHMKTKTTF